MSDEYLAVEDIDNALRELDQLYETWNDRLSSRGRFLRKDYLEERIDEVAIIRISGHDGRAAAGQNFRIVIWADDEGTLFGAEGSVGTFNHLYNGSLLNLGPYRNNRFVFVGDVEVMNNPKGFSPSFVGFEPPDKALNRLTDALYPSREVFFFKLLPSLANWETALPRRLFSIQFDALDNDVFKCTSKIVNAVADHHAPFDGDMSPKALLPGFRIALMDEPRCPSRKLSTEVLRFVR